MEQETFGFIDDRTIEIYRITSPEGKSYIGQTSKGVGARFKQHVKLAFSNREYALSEAIRKFGPDSFSVEILSLVVGKPNADLAERDAIRKFSTKFPLGYNMTDGGERTAGCKHSAATRKKISEANMGHPVSDATRQRIGAQWRGKKLPKEILDKMSAALKGHRGANLGKKTPDDIRAKISAALKGRKRTEEVRKRMSEGAKQRWMRYHKLRQLS